MEIWNNDIGNTVFGFDTMLNFEKFISDLQNIIKLYPNTEKTVTNCINKLNDNFSENIDNNKRIHFTTYLISKDINDLLSILYSCTKYSAYDLDKCLKMLKEYDKVVAKTTYDFQSISQMYEELKVNYDNTLYLLQICKDKLFDLGYDIDKVINKAIKEDLILS